MEVQEFKGYTESMDLDNQLEVSIALVRTPRQKNSTTWMEKMETYEKFNFQVFIMDDDGYGKNPILNPSKFILFPNS